MSNALLIVDVQNDYFPQGRMELRESVAAMRKIKGVIERFRAEGKPVVYVQHVSEREGAGFFLPGTDGVEIHAEIAPRAGDDVVVKHYPNSFRETGLHELLRRKGVDGLTIVGMMTHMCVDTTVRAAFDLGFKIELLEDCCATRDLRRGDAVIPAHVVQQAYMASLDGVFCSVRTSDGA
jgi:nicotinamidase-related amidase